MANIKQKQPLSGLFSHSGRTRTRRGDEPHDKSFYFIVVLIKINFYLNPLLKNF
jgi:hypothetical protein